MPGSVFSSIQIRTFSIQIRNKIIQFSMYFTYAYLYSSVKTKYFYTSDNMF